MKRLYTFLISIVLLMVCRVAFSLPDGFYLPDSIKEMTLRYRAVHNLIVLPVTINDSMTVNLILDTGCRNLVLFGKKFRKLLQFPNNHAVQFSGLGSGKPVNGNVSLYNKIAIHQVLGERIPVVVVPSKNLFRQYQNVDGVIGFELFLKFEIELDPSARTIKFRPAQHASTPDGFSIIPLRLVDLRPVMDSRITLEEESTLRYELMIDTGSNLGLLFKTTEIDQFEAPSRKQLIGYGFNGAISGYQTSSESIHLDGLAMYDIPTGIIESPWHNYASIGMQILKDYVVVINYYKLYAGFKRSLAG
ncbi:MAG TPA: aspartyl protease family protein [Chryseosolibacter sp.]